MWRWTQRMPSTLSHVRMTMTCFLFPSIEVCMHYSISLCHLLRGMQQVADGAYLSTQSHRAKPSANRWTRTRAPTSPCRRWCGRPSRRARHVPAPVTGRAGHVRDGHWVVRHVTGGARVAVRHGARRAAAGRGGRGRASRRATLCPEHIYGGVHVQPLADFMRRERDIAEEMWLLNPHCHLHMDFALQHLLSVSI